VQSDESSAEVGRNPFKMSRELTQSEVASQELLMNATKGAHEVTQERPHAFGCVEMHFADADGIRIAHPCVACVTKGEVGAVKVVVAAPLIGIHLSADLW